MNYQVVFDIAQQSFPWWGPTIGILFILFSAALVFTPRLIRPMDSRGHVIMRLIGMVGLVITVPATVDSLTNGLRRYNYYHSLLQQQLGYVVVEGQVENFTPAPYTGNYSDSFTVNGVKFQYSEADLSPGFNWLSQNGGPINQNGIYVRISYVTDPNYPYRNRILRLEIKR